MAKRKQAYESFRYDLGGIVNEAVFLPNNQMDPKRIRDFQQEKLRVMEKLKYCDKLLFEYNAGVVIGLKNGNAYEDGGLKIRLHGKRQKFLCYPIYVNKDGIIEDPEEEINGKDVFAFIKELRRYNPKLRLDGSMTSGYCESEEMKELITDLNTRNSLLDVWDHQ